MHQAIFYRNHFLTYSQFIAPHFSLFLPVIFLKKKLALSSRESKYCERGIVGSILDWHNTLNVFSYVFQ